MAEIISGEAATVPHETPPDANAVVLLNRRQQPVEIHLGTEVRVLPPGGRTEIDAALLSLPQIKHLIGCKALSVAAPTEATTSLAAISQPSGERDARTGAAKPTKPKRADHGASTSAATPASFSAPSKGESA